MLTVAYLKQGVFIFSNLGILAELHIGVLRPPISALGP